MADGPRLHFPLLDVNHPLAEPKLGTFRAVVHAHRRFDELFKLQTGLVCETACFFRGWILGERPASADCFHSIFFDQKQPIFSTNFPPPRGLARNSDQSGFYSCLPQNRSNAAKIAVFRCPGRVGGSLDLAV